MTPGVFLADAAATEDFGRRLARSLPTRAVVFLRGDLGAGKTSLARALLRGLGVEGPVKSPTYTLIERYPLDEGEAAHLDLYRIAAASELDFLGLQDLESELRLWLVEWPDRGLHGLPAPDLEIDLRVEGSGRRLSLAPRSEAGRNWLDRLNEKDGLGEPS
jgi:tRNA threonylcarbamoyladenosine biosynthesis protein TsaE